MRKKDDTLRDTLLDCARCVADAEGIEAVNIRSIARKAGIATGTVYNYFANKDEILLALTDRRWPSWGTPSPPIPSAASWKKYSPF